MPVRIIEEAEHRSENVKRNSRSGCQECKVRRVKCDENFPVCRRCQRRGSLCKSLTQPSKHRLEVPWLNTFSFTSALSQLPNSNTGYLQWWLDRTSHIFAFDPDSNPLSFPILEHLSTSQGLLHALQSLSVAHQSYFDQSCISTSLAERSRAMILIKEELRTRKVSLDTSFLGVFILGIASSWTYEYMQDDFGKEHLNGARTIIDLMLQSQSEGDEMRTSLMLGYYLWWDAHSAILIPHNEIEPLDTVQMCKQVEKSKHFCHPLGGVSLSEYHHLGLLGRYCRRVLDTRTHDFDYELFLEDGLLNSGPTTTNQQLLALSLGYRNHGLILLYRICGRPRTPCEDDHETVLFQLETEKIIHQYAKEAIEQLMGTPVSSPYANLHGLILLTAGSELGPEDDVLRLEVIKRLRAVYSWMRVNTSLWAIGLLQELWALRETNTAITPQELMLQRSWMLSMA